MKKHFTIFLLIAFGFLFSQEKQLAPTPPMGFMTWNFFGCDIDEQKVKSLADAMVSSGLRDAGYNYIFIDDCWQGERDKTTKKLHENLKKFPSGIKALVDYVHQKGLKIGIYSDAAELTCAGYTASYTYEEIDAKSFVDWGFDYLKYDYCGAPQDRATAESRYKTMSNALKNSGRDIVFSVCEWGDRQPWLWAKNSGGHLWRTTADIRDKWQANKKYTSAKELHGYGAGIMDIVNINAELSQYAGPNAWNDPDMLVVGLYGAKGPSGDLGGVGCTDVEYQSQMSLWCLMASPLMITCDVRNMNDVTKNILMNKDIIAINQDILGKQAVRKIKNDNWQVFVKPLSKGNTALGVLNTSDKINTIKLNLADLGIASKKRAYNVWTKKKLKISKTVTVSVKPHETIVLKLY